MSTFVCDNCNGLENTALGQYWGVNLVPSIYPPEYTGKHLCSKCASPVFSDGTPTGLGQWHGKWPERQWDGVSEVSNRPKKKV